MSYNISCCKTLCKLEKFQQLAVARLFAMGGGRGAEGVSQQLATSGNSGTSPGTFLLLQYAATYHNLSGSFL